MIYFDNAATSGFHPSEVLTALDCAVKYLSANPGRSGHRLSVLGEEIIFKTRQKLSEMFNNGAVSRVAFTKNCTEALNTAIFGLAKDGSEVVTTSTEHNSVLRPLYHLENEGKITLKIVEPSNKIYVSVSDVLSAVTDNTSLVVVNAASNVTGAQNEFEKIGNALSKLSNKPFYLVDGAQAAGHIAIDMEKAHISALAVAGHKGLYAISGASALLFNDETDVKPLTYGGSGTESFEKLPSCYPELLESGTLNLAAISTLYDGACLAESGLPTREESLRYYTSLIISGLKKIGAAVYSVPNPFGIVAFSLQIPSIEAAERLSEKYDVAVRGGFHCAQLMHKMLKTDSDGLIRASLSEFNTENKIYTFLSAVREINNMR